MKRMVIVVAVIALIGVMAVAVLDPFAVAIVLAGIFGGSPPQIAEGKQFDWTKRPEPTWTALLRQHFPVGSPSAVLIATLAEQGFEVDVGHRTANYKWDGLPCDQWLEVDWSANGQGNISTISGNYGSACL